MTNNCRIACKDGYRTGQIVKRGAGSLEFGSTSGYACVCNVSVEEGLLALQQNIANGTEPCYLGNVVVSNGATLVTALDADRGTKPANGPTLMESFSGGGEIVSCASSGSKRLGFNIPSRTFTFSGMIHRGIQIWPAANGVSNVRLNLTGTASDTWRDVSLTEATIGVKKFGMYGEPSSLGKSSTIYWRGSLVNLRSRRKPRPRASASSALRWP